MNHSGSQEVLRTMAMAKTASLPWQCDQRGPQKRLEYLFNTGCFSDITVKCHDGVNYEMHRMVLAMCSPVLEGMLFGPLAKSADSLCLDDDSEALKYVFSHCYGVEFQCDDIEVALNIFKIADKYIFTDLKEKCILIICNLVKANNFKAFYDFVSRYNFCDLRDSCIWYLQQDRNVTKATEVLMWFSKNSPKHLLVPVFGVDDLTFDTWRNPKAAEISEDVVTIIQSNCCNDLHIFAGQVSGDVLKYIPGPLYSEFHCHEPQYAPVLKLSLTNSNAKEIIMALHERFSQYGREDIGIHISNEYIPLIAEQLSNLPCYSCTSNQEYPPGRVTLYFSDLTEENLSDMHYILYQLSPECDKQHSYVNAYMFPRCKLKYEDYTEFCENIYSGEECLSPYKCIRICSPYIDIKEEENLFQAVRQRMGYDMAEDFPYIKLVSSDNEIPGW